MSFSCESCVFSGRGLCEGPTNCPEESYWVWYVWVWYVWVWYVWVWYVWVWYVWVWSRNPRKEMPWPTRAVKSRTKNKMHINFLPSATHN